MGRLIWTPAGVSAQGACWALIRELQSADPLALVTVVVPNAASGLQLRRAFDLDSMRTSAPPSTTAGSEISHDSPGSRRGMINVRTTPLSGLAQALAAESLAAANKLPLTDTLHLAFVRAALAAHPRALYGLGRHPATARAVAETLSELTSATGTALAEIATRGRLASDLAAIERSRRDLTHRYYDQTEMYAAATSAIMATTAPVERVGQVILYQPTAFSSAQLEFCAALANQQLLSVVASRPMHAYTEAAPTAQMHTAFAAWYSESSSDVEVAPLERIAPVDTIVEAPEPHDELRWIANDIRKRSIDGLALNKIAIAMRVAEPYRRIAIQTLDAAGIACTGESARSLSATVGGRATLALLDLARGEWHRDSLISWLQSAPIRDPALQHRAPATQWDSVSRQAGVVAGFQQWVDRLEQWTPRSDQQRNSARHLLSFIRQLALDIEAPQPRSWPAWSTWLYALCNKYLGRIQELNDWPQPDVTAYERVLSAVESLSALDAAHSVATLEEVTATMTELLTNTAERVGAFGRGVYITTTPELRGCAFELVYIVGMSEGIYPPRGSENPLLSDQLRAEFLPDSPQQRNRAARERDIHEHAVASAQQVIYTYPRGDVREQRSFLPSQYVVAAASQRFGSPLDTDAIAALQAPWLRRVDSFTAALVEGTTLTRSEATTAALYRDRDRDHGSVAGHPLVACDPQLSTGFAALSSRASDSFGIYDGNIGDLAGLLPNRPLSPTALEEWARCPFRYFLTQVLHLREVERPETLDGISPRELGNLVHAVLDEFVRAAPKPQSPSDPWSVDASKLLLSIALQQFAAAEARGVTGRPLLWAIAQRQILKLLKGFLHYDELHRSERGVVPFHSELAFGIDPDPLDHTTEFAPPVTLQLSNERSVQFRGRIDRIDREPNGGLLVITDYKTGRKDRVGDRDDPVSAGRQLQLAVYALAVAPLAPDAEVAAYYWYLKEPANPVGYPNTAMPIVHQRLRDVAEQMFTGIANGNFPAVPGKPKWLYYSGTDSWEHCENCAFDRVCPLDRHRDYERKRDDDALISYRNLEIDELELANLYTAHNESPS